MIALNKPFGLAVQGGTKTTRHIDGMLKALEKDSERPRLVHRLDKDTGGLLLVAKTRIAAQRLGDAFKGHKVEKTYWALTAGAPRPRQGTISLPIAKRMTRNDHGETERVLPVEGEDAKKAITDYQIIEDADRVAFVAMRPVTGRTHQLRVHAAAIGYPILGDGKYGGASAFIEGVSPKLHLFCRSMIFPHPKTGRQITLSAPLTGHMSESWKFFSFDREAECAWPEVLR
jgi:23S rRNA pseudouridine955/2504/2580 synthase